MLTIWILFKSFKRVYIDEISRWYLVFFFSCIMDKGKWNFHFSVKSWQAVLKCSVQSTSPIFRNNGHYLLHLQKGGRLCRVPGEGEHELLIKFKIFSLNYFATFY